MRKYLYAMMSTIAVSMAVATPAQAYFYNASDLLDGAREVLRHNQGGQINNYQDAAKFRTYAVAIYDVAELEGLICSPRGTMVGQASALTANWIVNNPQDWSRPAANVVFEALLHHFPCVDQE
mgnify:CR=1 FL=1